MPSQPSDYDIFRWPDGTECYRQEYNAGEFQYMSDDYIVLPCGSADWQAAMQEQEREEARP